MQELPEVWITITPDPRLGCYWVMIGCAQNTERFNLINEDAAELIRGACLKTVDAAELVRLIRRQRRSPA